MASECNSCHSCPAELPASLSDNATGEADMRTVQSPSHEPKNEFVLRSWKLGKQYPIIDEKVYFMSLKDDRRLMDILEQQRFASLSQSISHAHDQFTQTFVRRHQGLDSDRVFFTIDNTLMYHPFAEDFGPLSIGACYEFSILMRQKLTQQAEDGKKIVMYTSANRQQRTNAACLLASWLVLELGWTPQRAWEPFEFGDRYPFLSYRDASFQPVTFPLHVHDVLAGLYRASRYGILSLNYFDHDFYNYCDNPANGDVHVVVPGVFAAFKGPSSRASTCSTSNDSGALLQLPPQNYVDVFKKMKIREVVRLNAKNYDEAVFERAGFRHHSIVFDDCSTPNEDILARWFKICRERKGTMAVHCKAGLGRTGTLICCWLMRKYKFTGREAIGYIRVMRPGSVLGPQQEFLENNEQLMWAMGDPDVYGEDLMWKQAQMGSRKCLLDFEARHRSSMIQSEKNPHSEVSAEQKVLESRQRQVRARENSEAMFRQASARMRACAR